MTYYQSAVVTIALSCIISEIKRDIGRKSRFFSYPCIQHSRQGIIAGTTAIRFAVEKLEWCGYLGLPDLPYFPGVPVLRPRVKIGGGGVVGVGPPLETDNPHCKHRGKKLGGRILTPLGLIPANAFIMISLVFHYLYCSVFITCFVLFLWSFLLFQCMLPVVK